MRSFAEAPQLFWDIITLKIFRTVEKSDVQSLIFLEYLKFSSQWFQDLWLNAFLLFFFFFTFKNKFFVYSYLQDADKLIHRNTNGAAQSAHCLL